MCADPGARTPIGVSGNSLPFLIYFFSTHKFTKPLDNPLFEKLLLFFMLPGKSKVSPQFWTGHWTGSLTII
jgi:hypothetical protein